MRTRDTSSSPPPPIHSSRGFSVRTSAGSGTSAGTGVRDDEPPGTVEADGRRGALGEDDEPLGTGEAGHGRGAAGAARRRATTTPVQQRATACAPPEARGYFVSMKALL